LFSAAIAFFAPKIGPIDPGSESKLYTVYHKYSALRLNGGAARLLHRSPANMTEGDRHASRPKIAVLIPAYNEEKNIEAVLREVHQLQAVRPRWNILPVVVNDGSQDRTKEVLSRIAPNYGAVAIHLPLNLGIGCAVQTGFKYAVNWGADVALQLDGDGQHPADQIPAIICAILARKADVVIGSRYMNGAGGNVSTRLRQTGTIFFSKLLRLLVGIQVKDTTSGFRAFNREAIDYLSRYYPDDYPEVEAYVPLARKKFVIMEVAVKMRPRVQGASSITPLRSLYYMIKVALATTIGLLRPLPVRYSSPNETMGEAN
jgi:glycosyltransferase involved in cell wall biosynthesis